MEPIESAEKSEARSSERELQSIELVYSQIKSNESREIIQKSEMDFEDNMTKTDLKDQFNDGNHLPPDLDMVHVNRFRWILFASNFCVNIDMGILPACTLKMSHELKLETAEFGLLGSIVYVGQVLGCIIAAVMF